MTQTIVPQVIASTAIMPAAEISTKILAGAQLQSMAQQLASAGCPTPRLDARLILRHVYNRAYAKTCARGDKTAPRKRYDYAGYGYDDDAMLDATVQADCAAMLARRLRGEPISRIRGRREFWSLDFALSPHCLDPRPDSETLVAAAIHILKKTKGVQQIIDYGTGSGCLLIAILSEIPHAQGIGLDCAADAIATASMNAEVLGVGGRARMLVSDWCDALADMTTKADMIIANPPYIASGDIATLAPEVRLYDPRRALDGGVDGLDAWRAIFPRIKKRLADKGTVLVEIGAGQKPEVVGLATVHGLRFSQEWCDLAGIVRVLGFHRA